MALAPATDGCWNEPAKKRMTPDTTFRMTCDETSPPKDDVDGRSDDNNIDACDRLTWLHHDNQAADCRKRA